MQTTTQDAILSVFYFGIVALNYIFVTPQHIPSSIKTRIISSIEISPLAAIQNYRTATFPKNNKYQAQTSYLLEVP